MTSQRARTLTRPASQDEQDVAENWRAKAACRTADPELFFLKAFQADAIAICRECPVRRMCLEFALAADTTRERRYGVYGGKTPGERADIAKRRAS